MEHVSEVVIKTKKRLANQQYRQLISHEKYKHDEIITR